MSKKIAHFIFLYSLIHTCTLKSSDIGNEYSDSMTPLTKVVLTCDGGGVRGILSLKIIEEIEKRAGIRIAEGCDLIEGTSTGGLQALGLTCPDEKNPTLPKYSATELLNIYYDYGKTIFPYSYWRQIKTFFSLFGSKYSGAGIREVANLFFKDTLLSKAVTKVGIVTNDISPNAPYVFYSDDKAVDWYMRDVALATSAAPTYFPVTDIVPLEKRDEGLFVSSVHKYFIDGGVSGMNNPSTRAYADITATICREAKEDLSPQSDINIEFLTNFLSKDVRFISIGTGCFETHQSFEKMKNGGVAQWISSLINLTIGMPSVSNDEQMLTFLPPFMNKNSKVVNRYWRLNPTISKSMEEMDNVTNANCIALTKAAEQYIQDNDESINEIAQALKSRAHFKKLEKTEKQNNLSFSNGNKIADLQQRKRRYSNALSEIEGAFRTVSI